MPSVDLCHARTDARDPAAAAEDICRQFGSVKPKLVTLFASRDRDQRALNHALRERLPKETRLLGATTGGEIDQEGMHAGSVVASALTGDFDVGLGFGKNLSGNATLAGEAAIEGACEELGVRGDALSSKKYVALVIDDGFRYKKEEMLLGVMSKNQALVAVGGGASDSEGDPTKASAEVHVDGDVASDSVAVALFSHRRPVGRAPVTLVRADGANAPDHESRLDGDSGSRDRRQTGRQALRRADRRRRGRSRVREAEGVRSHAHGASRRP